MSGHEEGYPDWPSIWSYWYPDDAKDAPPIGDHPTVNSDHPAGGLTPTTIFDLTDQLKALGVEGRPVMVHSSYRALGPVEGGPAGALKALMDAVGSYGLLFVPAFNFYDWPEQGVFSRESTLSEMGIISRMALESPEFVRTQHPIYSFSVYGAAARLLPTDEPESAFSLGGVFDTFYSLNGLLLNLGVKRPDGNIPFPIIHFAENLARADHREHKSWTGTFAYGPSATYGMTVRKPGVITRVKPAIDELTAAGIVRDAKVCGADCQIAAAGPFVDGIVDICQRTPEKLFAIEGEE